MANILSFIEKSKLAFLLLYYRHKLEEKKRKEEMKLKREEELKKAEEEKLKAKLEKVFIDFFSN